MLVSTAQRISLYLIVAASLGTVLSSEVLAPAWWAYAGAAIGLSLATPLAWRQRLGRSRVIGLFLVVAFVAIAFDTLRGRNEIVAGATMFLMIVLLSRLFTERGVTEATQILTLSLLVVLAGSALNTSFAFVSYFVAYVVLSVWTLTTTHLSRVTTGASATATPLRISRSFFILTSLLALAIFAQTTAFFLIFPRLGVGYFRPKIQTGQNAVGFSDKVELGGGGNLRNDPTIVLRLEFTKGIKPLNPARLYFRGATLTGFDGRRWQRRAAGLTALRPDVDNKITLHRGRPHRVLPFVMYQEPSGGEYVFLPEGTHQIGFGEGGALTVNPTPTRLFTDSANDVMAVRAQGAPLRLEGSIDLPGAATAASDPSQLDVPPNDTLALPAEVDDRIVRLAAKWSADEINIADKARAISTKLQTTYAYTTEMIAPPPDRDPLSFFLFERRQGHCEYFASALAVMLRSQGIAARLVNGYLGMSYNKYGDYYSVQEYRAHTWVEFFTVDRGWQAVDPTPVSPELESHNGVLERMSAFFDMMRYRWNRYVIDYNIEAQVGALQRMRDFFQTRSAPRLSSFAGLERAARNGLLVAAALFVAAGAYLARRRFRKKSQPAVPESTLIYRHFQRLAAKQGIVRSPPMGPEQLANLVAKRRPALADAAQVFIAWYLKARFGGDDDAVVHLRGSLKKFRAAVKRAKNRAPGGEANRPGH